MRTRPRADWRGRPNRKIALKAFLYSISVLGILLAGVAWWARADYTHSGPLHGSKTVVFASGEGFSHIADALGAQGVIAHPLLFKALVFFHGDSAHFKAGEYIFPAYVSAQEVEAMMTGGKTVVHHLTVPEGLMTSEILEIITQTTALDGEITLDVKEGELLPETYNFSRGDKRNDIIARMRRAMQKTLDDAWAHRAQGLPFTSPGQALTLASIVERETRLAFERPHVAAVYINRLNKGILLQADPTTAYAVTGGKHKLTRPLSLADLQLNSPYNTYRVLGLPPGPIANPGRASILATLHPMVSDDLYFVASGFGGHNFARTEAEHAKNVKKYREHER